MKNKKLEIIVFAAICIIMLILSRCIEEKKPAFDPRGGDYIGSSSCNKCHQNITDSFNLTAHHQSTREASKKNISGSFSKDSNTLFFRPELKVIMHETDSGFYQQAYIDNKLKKSERFDLVFGSGRKGQSYLFWDNDKIFQLPVSYYVPTKSWENSPGFPKENVLFSRNIPIGCFECHASYLKKTGGTQEGGFLVDHFDRNLIVQGIDCERCHGPAAKHVNYHEQHSAEKEARFIPRIGLLSRQQQLDLCAGCHSGARETLNSLFYFKPGDKLSDYLSPDTAITNPIDIDVHGKQYQSLLLSQCFIKSSTLTCSSCHNTHIEQRDNNAMFSAQCKKCHESPKHNFPALSADLAIRTETDCIDCHMPTKPSNVIKLTSEQKNPISAMVRSHFISVYPAESKKILDKVVSR